ncbi:MAG: Gfo/Idh/MocA family oxidoreductase [Clostridia bacterium]|nr:Gfo/Idh/MocA family oxidoreductase [Clostridia bacterium]
MKPLRWGIVGPGNIAHRFARDIRHVPECEITAVASRDRTRGAAFAEEFSIPHVFESYEAMAKSPLIDAAYIATPHPFHRAAAELFLREGKAVLCEKPMCVNAREAEELIAVAKEHGAFLMEAMWMRFLPAVTEAVERAKAGVIGKVRGLSADFCYSLRPESEPKIFTPAMAGGGLLDVGVYPLHLAAMLFGTEPTSLDARSTLREGVDIHTAITLTYEGGAIATLSSGTMVKKPENAYIYGEDGYITLPCFYSAREYTVTRRDGSEERISLPFDGGFCGEIREAQRCITEGRAESELHPLSTTVAVLRQMDAVRKSIGVSYPFDKKSAT